MSSEWVGTVLLNLQPELRLVKCLYDEKMLRYIREKNAFEIYFNTTVDYSIEQTIPISANYAALKQNWCWQFTADLSTPRT